MYMDRKVNNKKYYFPEKSHESVNGMSAAIARFQFPLIAWFQFLLTYVNGVTWNI